MRRDNQGERPYCRTGECSRTIEHCLTKSALVASSTSPRRRLAGSKSDEATTQCRRAFLTMQCAPVAVRHRAQFVLHYKGRALRAPGRSSLSNAGMLRRAKSSFPENAGVSARDVSAICSSRASRPEQPTRASSPRGTESLETLRWRGLDSNLRSRCDECRVRNCRSGRRSFRAPGGLFVRTHVPDAGGRERQLVGHCFERGQSIGDGVGHEAADRDDRALAGALDAERVAG